MENVVVRARVPKSMKKLLEGRNEAELVRRGVWLALAESAVFSHNELDRRFGLSKGTIATMNSRLDSDAFAKWSFERDPDRKAWRYSRRGVYQLDLETTARFEKEAEIQAVLSDPKVARVLSDPKVAQALADAAIAV